MTTNCLLTVRDVAEFLGVGPNCVYRWSEAGKLPCVRLSQRCLRFRAQDIEKFVAGLVQPANREMPNTWVRLSKKKIPEN